MFPDEALAVRYARDSEPMTDAREAAPLATLLAEIDEAQERILAALGRLTMADVNPGL